MPSTAIVAGERGVADGRAAAWTSCLHRLGAWAAGGIMVCRDKVFGGLFFPFVGPSGVAIFRSSRTKVISAFCPAAAMFLIIVVLQFFIIVPRTQPGVPSLAAVQRFFLWFIHTLCDRSRVVIAVCFVDIMKLASRQCPGHYSL